MLMLGSGETTAANFDCKTGEHSSQTYTYKKEKLTYQLRRDSLLRSFQDVSEWFFSVIVEMEAPHHLRVL